MDAVDSTFPDRAAMVSRSGSCARITLARPDRRNVLDHALVSDLQEHFEAINDDIGVRCIVLDAQGPVFCAGGDVKAMAARSGHFAGSAAENRRYYDGGVQRLARAFQRLEVPIIAAVGGPAIGAGFDIALMCDIRVASTSARFAESFINLGLVSAAGGAWYLPRIAGPAVAAELIMTGEQIDADRALSLGIVSKVVADADLATAADDIAAKIAAHPPHSIRLNKRLLRELMALPLISALELAADLQAIVQHTADQHEAVMARVDRRSPNYQGR